MNMSLFFNFQKFNCWTQDCLSVCALSARSHFQCVKCSSLLSDAVVSPLGSLLDASLFCSSTESKHSPSQG